MWLLASGTVQTLPCFAVNTKMHFENKASSMKSSMPLPEVRVRNISKGTHDAAFSLVLLTV